jgi:hypothetical protein
MGNSLILAYQAWRSVRDVGVGSWGAEIRPPINRGANAERASVLAGIGVGRRRTATSLRVSIQDFSGNSSGLLIM